MIELQIVGKSFSIDICIYLFSFVLVLCITMNYKCKYNLQDYLVNTRIQFMYYLYVSFGPIFILCKY